MLTFVQDTLPLTYVQETSETDSRFKTSYVYQRLGSEVSQQDRNKRPLGPSDHADD